MTYERITATDGASGQRQTHTVRILSETERFVVGLVVNDEGEGIVPRGADERQWLIERECIERRVPLVMDRHYGVLVEAAT